MDSEWLIRIVIFGIIHWILAGFFLNDISLRRKVFGRRKAPWVIIILLVPCFGSILYLLFHPQIFSPDNSQR